MAILASVIIPAYNAASTIEDCLRALKNQTLPADKYEVILVDDGSTDATAAIAETLSGVQLVRARHRGAAAARNCGALHARAPILLFTDADCEPEAGWVEAILAPFGEPDCAGAKGVYGTRQRELVARFVQVEYEEKYARMRGTRAIDFVDTYSAAYARDVFLACGGFDEQIAYVEDQEFSFRVTKRGHRLVFAPGARVFHRHAATLAAYARKKFGIGYWKVRVHRRHPDKMWHDSHTPGTLKLQLVVLFALLASLVVIPFTPYALILTAVCAVIFLASALPLLALCARRDLPIVFIAPGMLALRAAALGAGLIAGVLHSIARSILLKRAIDIVGASLALVLCAPLVLLIAAAIKLDSRGPVFFRQERAGLHGKPFKMCKFRTMVVGAEVMLDKVIAQSVVPPPAFKIPNDPRVTRVGRVLRRTSLDELPQFINVLKGEMSLVGPRPEETRVVELYNDWQRKRLAVRPGLTGPMQTRARGALPLDERVQLELDYIENFSLWLDLRLLLETIPAVIRGSGAF